MNECRLQSSPEAVDLVYPELRRLAARAVHRERHKDLLQPTELLHEAYLRLRDRVPGGYSNRAQFYRLAGHVMRNVLVDHARRRLAGKRGKSAQQISLSGELADTAVPLDNLLVIDELLNKLEETDPTQASVVELLFFSGMTTEETAQALDISSATVKREWRFAKAWLRRALDLCGDAPLEHSE